MTNEVALVGGGGHCKACIDIIEMTEFKIAGIVDKDLNGSLTGYKLLGSDDDLAILAKKFSFLITVGQIKTPASRRKLFATIKQAGGRFITVVSPTAIVSKRSEIGDGTIIMHHSIVNANTKIGSNCIINNKSLVEHDCTIGDHTHISTAAVVNGGCIIGNGVFVGSNAVIVQGITVADDVVIGAGSVVVDNISIAGTYAGNPAKVINQWVG